MSAPGWTEATLRAAASWQAFKEGRQCVALATLSASDSASCAGTVRSGGRMLRTRVLVHSPTHVEVRCSCRENQATGAVCAHGVALALAALKAAETREKTGFEEPADAKPAENGPAWCVEFPPNWQKALVAGRLNPILKHGDVENEGKCPQDAELNQWLAAAGGVLRQSPQFLHLAGEQLAGFLACLIEHPRVFGKDGPLQVAGSGRLRLKSVELTGETVRLELEKDMVSTPCGNSRWLVEPGGITQLHPAATALPERMPLRVFLEQLDLIQRAFHFPDDCFVHRLRFRAAPFEVTLRLEGDLRNLRATPAVRYRADLPALAPGQAGDTGLPRLDDEGSCLVRDTDGERQVLRTLAGAGFQAPERGGEPWRMQDGDGIARFLSGGLAALAARWNVSESAGLSSARAKLDVVRPQITVTAAGEDWLEFDLAYQTEDGGLFSPAEVQRLLRGGKGRGRGKSLVLDEQSEILPPLFAELDLRQQNGRFVASKLAAAVVLGLGPDGRSRPPVSGAGDGGGAGSPPGLRAELRPYQRQGLEWLYDCLNRFSGALLADDMGLGKTLQTIAAIERLSADSGGDGLRILVVAPTGLLGNWAAEFGRFAPQRRICVLHGADRDERRAEVGPGVVTLTSFGTLARDLAWHLRQDYDLAVVDEASQMRNPDTDHAKALCKLQARRRLALTGTPVENSVRDLWSIFRFLLPGWLGDRPFFRDHYEAPLAAAPPDRHALERLRLKTAPFVLRRTKAQVAPELPAKLVIDEFCDLSTEQQAVYRQLLRAGRERVESGKPGSGAARMHLLTALLRLRQACCDLTLLGDEQTRRLPIGSRSAKMERLLSLLETAIAEGSRVLVFSQFRTQLLAIGEQLAERGWDFLQLDGQTPARQSLVDRFQAPGGPPLMLISLKAGGYGLNLTAADTVIHFDPWWNPAAEAQATDRAHRIGQTRPVTVYRLLARGTVEEKVLRLQVRKRDAAAVIDETGEGDAPALAESELRELLAGG